MRRLGDAESVFEEDVAQVIRGWGYEAVPQVGAAGYRIDIAVRHPDLPGAYVLAVECDGAAYHSAKTARDRDRLREEVLVRLGWRVHRIWGISWVRDRSAQMQRLREAIDAAVVSFGEAPLADTSSARGSAVEVVEADSRGAGATGRRLNHGMASTRQRHPGSRPGSVVSAAAPR